MYKDGGTQLDKIFMRADADKDGKLNIYEFTQFLLALYVARYIF